MAKTRKSVTKKPSAKNYSCPACGSSKDFGGPIGLAKHYARSSIAHCEKAMMARYGYIPTKSTANYKRMTGISVRLTAKRSGSPMPPRPKSGADTVSTLPTVKRPEAKIVNLKFCTGCGAHMNKSWEFCGWCGAKSAKARA